MKNTIFILIFSILIGITFQFKSVRLSGSDDIHNSNKINTRVISTNDKKPVYEKYLNGSESTGINLDKRMQFHNVPGVSIAVIKNGKLDWAKGFGILQKGKTEKINPETMFSVGSISKVGAAVIALKLVQQEKLSLNSNVNNYLKRWKIKENKYTKNEPVSLYRIMSHTAGLTVHGFADFLPEEKLPTLIEILNGTGSAKNRAIIVDIPVGSAYRYSGGGTMVEQILIEDVTNTNFNTSAINLLFNPLNMNRSSYLNPLPESFKNIAKAHDRNGKPAALPKGYHSMPEAAASGLWTTPSDLAKLIISLMNSYHGISNQFLYQELVVRQMTSVSPGSYGLGPKIDKNSESFIFSHGGANDCYRAHFKGYMHSKSGIIVFTNGTNGGYLINEIIPVLRQVLES